MFGIRDHRGRGVLAKAKRRRSKFHFVTVRAARDGDLLRMRGYRCYCRMNVDEEKREARHVYERATRVGTHGSRSFETFLRFLFFFSLVFLLCPSSREASEETEREASNDGRQSRQPCYIFRCVELSRERERERERERIRASRVQPRKKRHTNHEEKLKSETRAVDKGKQRKKNGHQR